MSTMAMRDYGSPGEIAQRLGVSLKTVRRLYQSGKLLAHKIDRRVMIAYEDAEALVRRSVRTIQPIGVTSSTLGHDGRALAFSDAESRTRARLALAALDDEGDESNETDEADHFAALHAGLQFNRAGA